jgi:hypothetical protein
LPCPEATAVGLLVGLPDAIGVEVGDTVGCVRRLSVADGVAVAVGRIDETVPETGWDA